MQIHNAIITGSFSYNGADLSNVTSSNAYSASLSSRTTDLESTSSVLVGASSSFSSVLSSVSSSQQQLSSSFLTLTASFNAVSASQQQISSSYIALSASYNTFSGSASTRITVDSASLLQVSASQQQISASYIALSGSYNVFSGSASTRVTQIETVYATTGSNSFRANQSITGSLVVSSTITAQTLVVQTVTSSIVYSSGSNLFGSALTDRQTFTGSVNITGSSHAIFGNVGIGTTNPTSSLDVSGNVYIRSSSGGVLYIPRLADTSHGLSIGEQSIIGSKSAVIRTGGGVSEHLFIDPGSNDSNVAGNIALAYANTGSVGIGTYLPSTKLQVVGLTGGASGGATGIPSLGFANSSSIALFTNKDTNYGTLFGTLNTGVGWIQQQRVDGTGTAYNLLLQPNGGNVGIGTSTFNYAGAGIGYLAINGSSSNFLEFQYSTTGTSGWITGNSSTLNMFTSGPKDLLFGTAGGEKMRITSAGTLMVGACINNGNADVSPIAQMIAPRCTTTYPLTLTTSGAAVGGDQIRMSFNYGVNWSATAYIGSCVENAGSAATGMVFGTYSGGLIESLRISSTGIACFRGTVCAPCFATISDYRMKSNVRPIDGLSIIMNTKPYKFEYNYDCSTSFGMIAHELQDTLPEAVFGQKDGEVMQGVDYMKLLPITIKAIQEQQCTICSQASMINQLKTCLGII